MDAKIKTKILLSLFVLFCLNLNQIFCQDQKSESDTIVTNVVKDASPKNVMLNAADNTGPRNVNIGLPPSVGGTTILENGLPVVYYFWPEFPVKAWRQDASLNKLGVLKLGETAIYIGDVGYAVDSYTNLGTDTFQLNGSIASNSYWQFKGDIDISGPIARDWYYTVSAYVNLDPGTFKMGFNKYFDNTQMYKAGINKKYDNGKGEMALTYKYVNTRGMAGISYSPFIYNGDGSVSEISGFKIGRDSYFERSGKLHVEKVLTGEYQEDDVINDYLTYSHTIDLTGKNKFNNGMNLEYILRYHTSRASSYLPAPIGVSVVNSTQSRYTYLDDGSAYSGQQVQTIMALASSQIPIHSITSRIQLSGVSENKKHSWKVGFNEWHYYIDKFNTSSSVYYHEIAPQPRKLALETLNQDGTWTKVTDDYGISAYNTGMEYHDGNENRLAVFASDDWKVSEVLTLGLGARLEYQRLNGDHYPYERTPNDYITEPLAYFVDNWFNKAFTANALYKVTSKFGVLGEAGYNQIGGHLENYSGDEDDPLKQSTIPSGSIGVFYNHPLMNVVSQATYIQQSNYRTRLTLSDPSGQVLTPERVTAVYKIQTWGWTTDVLATPFKNFDFHFLFTLQKPQYQNYNFQAFGVDYSYDGKVVQGISQVLVEIDPSYTFWNQKMRAWLSARYFSKQYANQPNTLYFNGHWETFAGLNYTANKNLEFWVDFVNLLGQRGAQGSMTGGELIEDASVFNGQIVTGTYIRPFTCEFGLKYKF